MTSKDLVVQAGEILEAVFSSFVIEDQSLLKDIPVVSTVAACVGFYSAYKAKSFEKKFYAFLNGFTEDQLKSFKKFIKNKSTEDVGFEVINLLDKLDKVNQVQMMARALNLYISCLEQEMNEVEESEVKSNFEHNIHIIKQLDDYLLSAMHSVYTDPVLDDQNSMVMGSIIGQALLTLGLVEQKNEPAFVGAEFHQPFSFSASSYGKTFYKDIIQGTP